MNNSMKKIMQIQVAPIDFTPLDASVWGVTECLQASVGVTFTISD